MPARTRIDNAQKSKVRSRRACIRASEGADGPTIGLARARLEIGLANLAIALAFAVDIRTPLHGRVMQVRAIRRKASTSPIAELKTLAK